MKKSVQFILLLSLSAGIFAISGCKDKCKDAVCLNGATCEDGECICALGFEGDHCENAVDPCTQMNCPAGQICSDGTCYDLPVASFTITGNGCTATCSILFTNTSEHATSYLWDFGDGSTSTEASPTHQFTTGGTFEVQLTATNDYGSNSVIQQALIQSATDPCAGVTCLNGGTCINGTCNCATGYSGPTCANEVTPSSMRITKITVTDFVNDGWDVFPASSPDIYVTVGTGTSCSSGLYSFGSSYYQDAYPGPNYDFIPSSPINISNPTSPIAICLYDDDVSGDEYMAGVYFNPYVNGDNFPSIRTLSVNGLTCKVYLTYYW